MFNGQVHLKLTSKDYRVFLRTEMSFRTTLTPQSEWIIPHSVLEIQALYFVLFSRTGSLHLPTTVGSKSTKTALGTCLPAPVSLKKVLKESSAPLRTDSSGIWPSGRMPCSRQYNSQHALPICTPAWPTWTEMHSRWEHKAKYCCQLLTRGRECRDVTQH